MRDWDRHRVVRLRGTPAHSRNREPRHPRAGGGGIVEFCKFVGETLARQEAGGAGVKLVDEVC